MIEVMVVLAIVAGVMGASVYSLGMIARTDLRNEAMRMTSAIQYTWGRAAMNNAQYRLVVDLGAGTYHTEVTDAPVVEREPDEDQESDRFMSEEAKKAEEESEKEESLFDDEEKDPFNLNQKPTYKRVKEGAVKERKLPEGISFESVVKANRTTPIEEGKAAIRFFPNGFQEPAIIVLKNSDGSYYSLKTEALTGRVKIYAKKLEKPEAFGQPEEVQEEW